MMTTESTDSILAPGRATSLFVSRRRVRFQDVNAARIVGVFRLCEYMHDAYAELLTASGLDLADVLAAGEWAAPVVHTTVDVKVPVRFGESMLIHITAVKPGRTSWTVQFEVVREGSNPVILCRAHIVCACVDRKTFKPCAIPDAIRALGMGRLDEKSLRQQEPSA